MTWFSIRSVHQYATVRPTDCQTILIICQSYAYQDGLSALFAAARNDHSEIVRVLLSRGASINAVNKVSDKVLYQSSSCEAVVIAHMSS